MKEHKKFEEMIDNCINGNLSDFRNSLEKMRKKQLVRFIRYVDLDVHEAFAFQVREYVFHWATT